MLQLVILCSQCFKTNWCLQRKLFLTLILNVTSLSYNHLFITIAVIRLYRYRTHKSIDFSKASGNNDINRKYGVSIGFLTFLACNALHSYSYNTTECHIQSEILKSKCTSFFFSSFSFNFSSSVSVTCEHLPLPLFSPGQQFFETLRQMQFQWDTQLLKMKLTKLW